MGDLLLEEVLLVEEQDHRGLGEPLGVADRVEQHQRLVHPIRRLVLVEDLAKMFSLC